MSGNLGEDKKSEKEVIEWRVKHDGSEITLRVVGERSQRKYFLM